MDDVIAKEMAAKQVAQGLISSANLLNQQVCREKTQTIVDYMVGRHQGQLAAWSYLQRVLTAIPPTDAEESSLWELVSSMRHQRY